MFPENIVTSESVSVTATDNIISNSDYIRKTLNYDYDKRQVVIKNGSVDLVDGYKNVRNWIIKFIRTPIDVMPIYEGTGFGTSAYKLKGSKAISGLQFAQIKKEVQDGFLLNPNILVVADFDMYKNGKSLYISVGVKLQDGYILKEKTEVWKIKG